MIGFFELLYNPKLNETEISYFGLLEEYIGKGIGGYALSEAIKKSFEKDIKSQNKNRVKTKIRF